MKNIIVAVDFSETAAAAVRFSTYLAEVMELNLVLLHVFDVMLSGSQTVSHRARDQEQSRLTEELKLFARKHVEPVLATFQGRLDTLPAVHLQVEDGSAAQQILWRSTEEDTALIVMGGVGAGTGTQPPTLFGGVARAVAFRGGCPVILIPKDYGYPQVERLAIAFDDARDVTRLGGFTRKIIEALRPEVRFVHVKKPNWVEELKNEDAFLELSWGPGFPSYTFKFDSLPYGEVVDRLLKYSKAERIDLLVLGSRKTGFFERLFRASHLRPLVRKCEVPLLIVPLED